jgi:methylaspartate mutase epsilon subunit
MQILWESGVEIDMEVKNKRLSDDEFFHQRKEVLAEWPTGRDVDLNEAVEYERRLL